MSNTDTSTEALDAECANLARLLGLGALTAIGQIRALAAERDAAWKTERAATEAADEYEIQRDEAIAALAPFVAARVEAAAVAMREALIKMAQERATYERPDPSYAVKDPWHFNECCAAADALDALVERMRAVPTPTDALAAALAQAKREGMEQAARIADSRRARHEAAARSPEADTDASASLFDAACEAGDIAAAIRAKAKEMKP